MHECFTFGDLEGQTLGYFVKNRNVLKSTLCVNVGFTPVGSPIMFRLSLALIDQEGVVSELLIGQTSLGGLTNIHEVTGGGVGEFVNAALHSTPSVWCIVSIFCFVLVIYVIQGCGMKEDSEKNFSKMYKTFVAIAMWSRNVGQLGML